MTNINITFFIRAAESSLEAEQQAVASQAKVEAVTVPETAGDTVRDHATPMLDVRVEIQEKKSDM